MNKIVNVKTKEVDGPKGSANAIMLAVDILDKSDLSHFIHDVVSTFTSQMMISPPGTTMMLITLMGDCTSEEFKQQWRLVWQINPILNIYMKKMEVADVMHGTAEGKLLNQTSLLHL